MRTAVVILALLGDGAGPPPDEQRPADLEQQQQPAEPDGFWTSPGMLTVYATAITTAGAVAVAVITTRRRRRHR